jgi:hypothetical protein
MSATVPTTPLPTPHEHSTIDELETWLVARKLQVQHGATMLLSFLQIMKKDVATVEQDPAVKAAVDLAVSEAMQEGVKLGLPETQIETLGKDVIAVAQAAAPTVAAEPAA